MIIAFGMLESGRLGPGMQLAAESIQLADDGGLIASSIGLRAELGWMHATCGDFSGGYRLVEQAIQVAESQLPAWVDFPKALKVRMHLLEGDLPAARRTTGGKPLQPITIPYARYTILLSLANVALAEAEGDHLRALGLADELLAQVLPLTRVDVPEALRWRAAALQGLGRLEEAQQALIQARTMAEEHAFNLHLWLILSDLAELEARLGQPEQAAKDREEARRIALQIGETLQASGLRESFLNQPRVKALVG
jgi:tetratricopeptide (TPR) repeat protein